MKFDFHTMVVISEPKFIPCDEHERAHVKIILNNHLRYHQRKSGAIYHMRYQSRLGGFQIWRLQ